jgi:hypothetical protein
MAQKVRVMLITAKFPGVCGTCRLGFKAGEQIQWPGKGKGPSQHVACCVPAPAPAPAPAAAVLSASVTLDPVSDAAEAAASFERSDEAAEWSDLF